MMFPIRAFRTGRVVMAKVREFEVCGAEKPRPEEAEKPYRPVLCNRPPGHDGPHRRTDVRTFQRLAEWVGESTAQPTR